MTQPGSLEQRLAALEDRVRELSEQVTEARILAGGADRDSAALRGELRDFRQATTASFNAMREDLSDLRARVSDGFTQADSGFAAIRGRLDATAAGQEQIAGLLRALIERGDS